MRQQIIIIFYILIGIPIIGSALGIIVAQTLYYTGIFNTTEESMVVVLITVACAEFIYIMRLLGVRTKEIIKNWKRNSIIFITANLIAFFIVYLTHMKILPQNAKRGYYHCFETTSEFLVAHVIILGIIYILVYIMKSKGKSDAEEDKSE